MTKNLPRVGFVFDGMATSPVFFGWGLGTLWNGFDNVAVSVDTRDVIADWFEQIAQDSATAADLREISPDSGRVDLSGGYTTRIVPQWRAEFPDYPVDDMPDPLPAGFVDHSWHNDDCPSFWHETTRTLLWVDYLDPSRREIEERPRFALMKTDENGASTQEPDCCVFQGETWLEVEAFLREYLPAAPTYPPAVDESNQADAPSPPWCPIVSRCARS